MLFLFDEMVHQGLTRFFSALRHDAKPVPKALPDGAVADLAVREGRILLTHDTDFAAEPPVFDHPGIILVRIPPRNFDDLKAGLTKLLGEKNSPDSFANRLFPLFKDRYDDFPFRAEKFPL